MGPYPGGEGVTLLRIVHIASVSFWRLKITGQEAGIANHRPAERLLFAYLDELGIRGRPNA